MSRDAGLDRWTTTGSGDFVACIVTVDPKDAHAAIELLIRGKNRDEVVKGLHALGYHSIRLKGDHRQVPDDYVSAVLASHDAVLWRPFVERGNWRAMPISL